MKKIQNEHGNSKDWFYYNILQDKLFATMHKYPVK